MKKITLFDVLYSKTMSFIIGFIILISCCYTAQFPMVQKVFFYCSYILSIGIIMIYILNRKFSKFSITLSIYGIGLMISSYLSDTAFVHTFFNIYLKIIAMSFYLDYGLKNYSNTIIPSMYKVFYILICINFYTLIKFPDGLYTTDLFSRNWFFDYDNTHIFMYFPAIVCMFFNMKLNKKKWGIFDVIFILLITFCVYYCFSANSVVAYTLFLIYLLMYKFINKLEIFNSRTYFIAYFVIFFTIVIFRLQNVFSWLIVGILGKDLTFTNRTVIWERVIDLIKTKLLLGYGQENSSIISSKLGNIHYTHAHNTTLDVLYKGGIITSISFLFLIIYPIKELYETRENELSKFISYIIFCLFIMMNFEAREEKIGLYIILVIAFNIKNIIKNLDMCNGCNDKINVGCKVEE